MSEAKETPAGKIPAFDEAIPAMLKYVDALIASDELGLAQQLLTSGMPGFYRDNPPAEVSKMKHELWKFLMNSDDYGTNWQDLDLMSVERGKEVIQNVLRGQLILKEIEAYNKNGITPHLVEMGPGEYWLPLGLKALDCKFTYKGIGLQGAAQTKAKELLGDHWKDQNEHSEPTIFAACELVEHLWNEQEIPHTAAKYCTNIDVVHLSTPLYTFGFGKTDWREKQFNGQGGHLRTYTPSEFMAVAQRLFPDYSFVYYHSHIMSIRGTKNG